jgi:hypothetical protein
VYFFAVIILFAFAAMAFIVYTDTNMTEFLNETRAPATIDPLFKVLEENLDLDLFDVATLRA